MNLITQQVQLKCLQCCYRNVTAINSFTLHSVSNSISMDKAKLQGFALSLQI